jgi:aminopeptidase N
MPVRRALLLSLVAVLSLAGCGRRMLCQMPAAGESEPLRLTARAAELRLDPASHRISTVDSLWYTGSLARFELHAGLEVQSVEINGRTLPAKHLLRRSGEHASQAARAVWLLDCSVPREGLAVIRARGELWQDPASMRFGRETVGHELQATVGGEGIWLADGAAVLADPGGAQFTPLRIHLELPAAYSGVTQGRLIRDEVQGSLRRMSWEETLPTEGFSLVANRFDIRRETHGGVEISTWFIERDPAAGPFVGHDGRPVDDEAVRATLHRMCAYYLDMYTELIGPYPYAKFAVVESFFPAGYGMPSWTLLGDAVIRMPYIPYTSLGHELLHNYWGNGVFVAAGEGNWCEGLTVLDADYRYKLLESPEAAREYRKGLLKDYRSHVHAGGRDLPLSEFRSRHDGATRAVGYGKSMMVFLMLENLLGREGFGEVRREIWKGFQGRAAAWSDWIAACERRGQLDLATFAAQWLERPGAPSLALEELDWEGGLLRGRVLQTQPGPAYELDLPLVVEAHDGSRLRSTIFVEEAATRFELACAEPRKVILDPDYEVFRLLDSREMEAVVSLPLADARPIFAAPRSWLEDPAGRDALAAFAQGLKEQPAAWISWEELDTAHLAGHSLIGLNPPALPAGLEYVDLRLSQTGWQLAGQGGDFAESSLVLALKSAQAEDKAALLFWVPGLEQLPALARKVPHYGKYSYLGFDLGGSNWLKGNLAPRGNPLEKRFGSW